eukprot:scaffold847_cov385-Prasinococcus_capsulatus_cf.AAC.10
MLKAAPSSGGRDSYCSNTLTDSMLGQSFRSAIAAVRPAGPPPITATLRGPSYSVAKLAAVARAVA